MYAFLLVKKAIFNQTKDYFYQQTLHENLSSALVYFAIPTLKSNTRTLKWLYAINKVEVKEISRTCF